MFLLVNPFVLSSSISKPTNVVGVTPSIQTFPQSNPTDLRKERSIDLVPIPYTEVFCHLIKKKLKALELPPQVPNPPPKWFNPSETYIYYIGA